MLGFMPRMRISGAPAILLTLVMGFGVVLQEAGHSHAHRQGGHAPHNVTSHSEVGHGLGSEVATGDAAHHSHPDLLTTLTNRPPLAYAAVAQTIVWLLSDLDNDGGLGSGVALSLGPIQNGHGPPPPTRAPPTI